ncbi:flagellar hook-basal body protein [Chitinimonas sp. JJ19]|uniref:flagellar hook-basal body protein n=1 Tax=Chitinimonas sp. JJ19 TaxID=3109352 RepID=UPI003001EF0B
MIEALYLGVSGMQSQQAQIDSIAHNLTNMNTPAFKASRVQFQEVMNQAAADEAAQGKALMHPAGVRVMSREFDFTPGSLKTTGSAMDIAINGIGFLPVSMPDGSVGYTRGGTLVADSNGVLSTREGYPLQAQIQLPSDAAGLQITPDGRVSASFADGRPAMELGRLELMRFARPDALGSQGGGVYQATEASGEAQAMTPGTDGTGTLAQGYLESANVNMADEMVRLMMAQRAYELGSKLVQASDELMGMTNNLRR